jgi:hypothetical protein
MNNAKETRRLQAQFDDACRKRDRTAIERDRAERAVAASIEKRRAARLADHIDLETITAAEHDAAIAERALASLDDAWRIATEQARVAELALNEMKAQTERDAKADAILALAPVVQREFANAEKPVESLLAALRDAAVVPEATAAMYLLQETWNAVRIAVPNIEGIARSLASDARRATNQVQANVVELEKRRA